MINIGNLMYAIIFTVKELHIATLSVKHSNDTCVISTSNCR